MSEKLQILAIDPDRQNQGQYTQVLNPPHQVVFCWDREEIPSVLKQTQFDVVIVGLNGADEGGLGILGKVAEWSSHTPVLAAGDSEEPSLIVKAIKGGAFDFVSRPFSREKLFVAIERAIENRSLRNEIDYLRRSQDVIYDFGQIIAFSPVMKRMIDTLKKFSQTDSTILVTGETGTGKSFLSGAVHFNSMRRTKPFIKINCANIPDNLLESELFGHEKGAFTGASKTRIGRLEQGKGGTVFLDEIGEMALGLQAKLLRFLEEKSFERLGGNRTIQSDVRLIAATNRDAEEQVREGKFREDLYYRLNVLRVHLPPLRERRECIPSLAKHLLNRSCRQLGKSIEGFAPHVLDRFIDYRWPGNIRQLANTIERAVILEDSEVIQPDSIHLPDAVIVPQPPPECEAQTALRSLDGHERQMILNALEDCLWVQKDAAALLGISPRALNYKIKKFHITHARWRRNR